MSSKPAEVNVRTPKGDLVARARVAHSLWSRLRGLIARPLPDGAGLLLPSCSSVHTHFMGYPIDVIYLSKDESVVKVVPKLRPWRFSAAFRGANHVLELPAGRAGEVGITRGQRLELEPAGVEARA